MRIAYFTPSSFRTVNAGALRNIGVAKALVLAGHDVTIICNDHVSDEVAKEWDAILRGSTISLVQGGSPRGKALHVFSRLARLLDGPSSDLSSKLSAISPDSLILYNAAPVPLLRLDLFARRNKLPFVVDITEWLNMADLPGGRFGALAVLHELTMRTLTWRRGRYLTISRTMAAKLGKRGLTPLVVPPIFDIGPSYPVRRNDHRTHLVSTGTDLRIRGKDIVGLSLVVAALAEVDPEGNKFHLDVVGTYNQRTKAYLSERLGAQAFTLHGPLSWEKTLSAVHSADFSVVLRDPADRRSNLGFPSKVPESLLLGTPILGNFFSDLAEHLEDGVNAIVVSEPTIPALISALRRLPIDIDREVVRKQAAIRYTPKAWSTTVSEFVTGEP